MILDTLAEEYNEKLINIKNSKTVKSRYDNHISPTEIEIKNSSFIFGKLKIKNIKATHVQELQKALLEKINPKTKKPYANRTIDEIIFVLRAMFNLAIKKNWCKSNPVIHETIERTTDDEEVGRKLSESQLEQLWTNDELVNNKRLFLFTNICYYTGARPDAVIHLQVKHIDFNENRIKFKAMKKNKAYRTKAKDLLIDLLENWIQKHKLTHENFIFFPKQTYDRAITKKDKEAAKNKPSNYSGYRRALQKIYDPIFNQDVSSYDTKYRVTTYSLRRTSATKIYKNSGIVEAQKFLNHSDIKTTMKYLHISEYVVYAAIDVL
jgi:integrase